MQKNKDNLSNLSSEDKNILFQSNNILEEAGLEFQSDDHFSFPDLNEPQTFQDTIQNNIKILKNEIIEKDALFQKLAKFEYMVKELERENEDLKKENVKIKLRENEMNQKFRNELNSNKMLIEQLKEEVRLNKSKKEQEPEMAAKVKEYKEKINTLTRNLKKKEEEISRKDILLGEYEEKLKKIKGKTEEKSESEEIANTSVLKSELNTLKQSFEQNKEINSNENKKLSQRLKLMRHKIKKIQLTIMKNPLKSIFKERFNCEKVAIRKDIFDSLEENFASKKYIDDKINELNLKKEIEGTKEPIKLSESESPKDFPDKYANISIIEEHSNNEEHKKEQENQVKSTTDPKNNNRIIISIPSFKKSPEKSIDSIEKDENRKADSNQLRNKLNMSPSKKIKKNPKNEIIKQKNNESDLTENTISSKETKVGTSSNLKISEENNKNTQILILKESTNGPKEEKKVICKVNETITNKNLSPEKIKNSINDPIIPQPISEIFVNLNKETTEILNNPVIIEEDIKIKKKPKKKKKSPNELEINNKSLEFDLLTKKIDIISNLTEKDYSEGFDKKDLMNLLIKTGKTLFFEDDGKDAKLTEIYLSNFEKTVMAFSNLISNNFQPLIAQIFIEVLNENSFNEYSITIIKILTEISNFLFKINKLDLLKFIDELSQLLFTPLILHHFWKKKEIELKCLPALFKFKYYELYKYFYDGDSSNIIMNNIYQELNVIENKINLNQPTDDEKFYSNFQLISPLSFCFIHDLHSLILIWIIKTYQLFGQKIKIFNLYVMLIKNYGVDSKINFQKEIIMNDLFILFANTSSFLQNEGLDYDSSCKNKEYSLKSLIDDEGFNFDTISNDYLILTIKYILIAIFYDYIIYEKKANIPINMMREIMTKSYFVLSVLFGILEKETNNERNISYNLFALFNRIMMNDMLKYIFTNLNEIKVFYFNDFLRCDKRIPLSICLATLLKQDYNNLLEKNLYNLEQCITIKNKEIFLHQIGFNIFDFKNCINLFSSFTLFQPHGVVLIKDNFYGFLQNPKFKATFQKNLALICLNCMNKNLIKNGQNNDLYKFLEEFMKVNVFQADLKAKNGNGGWMFEILCLLYLAKNMNFDVQEFLKERKGNVNSGFIKSFSSLFS